MVHKEDLLEMFITYDLEDLYGDFSDDGDGELELTEKGNEVATTLIKLVEQELDKAREEGMFDRFELSYIKTLHSEARAYRKYMGVTLTEDGEKRDKDFISKLSKLTTK